MKAISVSTVHPSLRYGYLGARSIGNGHAIKVLCVCVCGVSGGGVACHLRLTKLGAEGNVVNSQSKTKFEMPIFYIFTAEAQTF
jgi:hypothetical protein